MQRPLKSVPLRKSWLQSETWAQIGTRYFFSIFVVSLSLLAFSALAETTYPNGAIHAPTKPLLTGDMLYQYAIDQEKKKNPLPSAVISNSQLKFGNISDNVIEKVEGDTWTDIVGNSENVAQITDLLTRESGRFAGVIGASGVGKSAIVEQAVKNIIYGELAGKVQNGRFGNVAVLRISARAFLPGGIDIEAFFMVLENMERDLNLNLIPIIQDVQFMEEYHMNVLASYAQKSDHVPVILEADTKAHVTKLIADESFQRHIEYVLLEPPSRSDLLQILKTRELARVSQNSKIQLSDEVLGAVVDAAPEYRPDLADSGRAIRLLEDFAIAFERQSAVAKPKPTRNDVFKFIAQRLHLPVIPQDEVAFDKYIEEVRLRMKARVIAQDHLVDGLLEQWKQALTTKKKRHQSAVIMGPTGVGKSLVAEVLVEEFFQDKDKDSRKLKIDMTAYKDAQSARNALFGAANGFVSADKEKGIICEYLDGRGRNGGVIVLNEIEEAPADVITLFMELLDTGEVRGGDGRVRRFNRHLIIGTSNKNAEGILPAKRVKGATAAELDSLIKGITEDSLKKSWTEKESFTTDDQKTIKTAVPERFDHFYYARPHLNEDAIKIAKIEVLKWVNEYNSNHDGKVTVEDNFAETLVPVFYDETLGARQTGKRSNALLDRAITAFRAKYGYNSKRLTVSAMLHPARKTDSYITIKDEDSGNLLKIDGPRIPTDNKLLDVKFRKILSELEQELKNNIYGQDEAIEAVVALVNARYLNPNDKRTAAGALIGVTGSGKTEIAKVVSRKLYGREDAYKLFEMGKIVDEKHLGDIFPPPRPYIGSDKPGQIEEFLKAFPDGGVLLFDEFSNAGGNNKEIKSAIMKMAFYTLLDEGYYKSTATGKTYPLKNYIVLFTGNDGESALKGAVSDDMKEAVWEEIVKNPEGVNNILREAGLPDAFLGRLWFTNLMRPTTHGTKARIAEKMLRQWQTQIEAAQPVTIHFAADFVEQIGELMFSPQRGARSINDFATNPLSMQVAKEIVPGLSWDDLIESGKKADIHLNLRIHKPRGPFYEGDEPEKNEAVLLVQVKEGDRTVSTTEVEFTGKASFQAQVNKNYAKAVAYHEMGHAVASYTKVTGKKVRLITIVPEVLPDGRSAAGYTSYEEAPDNNTGMSWEVLIKNLAGLYAGTVAEEKAGFPVTAGRSSDIERVGSSARRIILENHLVPGLDAAHAYLGADKNLDNLPTNLRQLLEAEVNKAVTEAREMAVKTVNEQWRVVEAGVQLLMQHHTLRKGDFERLAKRVAETSGNGAIDLAGIWQDPKERHAAKAAPAVAANVRPTVNRESSQCAQLLVVK
jgi:ATP-dependent Clp protease ATP-binding subunit ClpA